MTKAGGALGRLRWGLEDRSDRRATGERVARQHRSGSPNQTLKPMIRVGQTRRLRVMSGLAGLSAAATLPPVGAANAQPHAAWARQVERWGVEEVSLSSTRTYANPFTEVKISASFRCAGNAVTAEGFYDGDGVWKVRFMPSDVGPCTFETHSSDPALDGATGAFVVEPAHTGDHGPVRVAKIYHYDYADGTPYFLLGTTSYNWLNRSQALQDETLASLGRTGFTKLRFGLFPKWYQFNHVEPPVFPYIRKPDGSFDLERFDPRFFANVEARLRQLGDMGIEADVILFHPYDHWGFAKMDEAHNEAWLRYVTSRLSAFHNVWWTMANEYDLMGPRDWNRLGEIVKSSDPYGHPIGIHNLGAWWDPTQPWIDHVIVQDGSDGASRTAAIARRRYGKPVVVDEYGYEGNNANIWGELSGRAELARHWNITMAGAYASHGETYVHPDGVVFWAAGGELVGDSPQRLAFLRSVMTALPFQDMKPASELVVNGKALASPGRAFLFYFPWEADTLDQSREQVRLAGASLFKVDLIDPWQMKTYPLGFTLPGDQAFLLPVAPALLRVTAAPVGAGPARPIGELLGVFSGNPSSAGPADASLFKPEVIHYSLDFPLAQIRQSPAAYAVLRKYFSVVTLANAHDFLPVRFLAQTAKLSPEKIEALSFQLDTIRVP